MEEYKNWEDLNFDERVKVLEGFKNTEDRNESDRDNPREEDVKDYYEDNEEKFGVTEGKPNLRRGVEFVTPNNEYYRNKNLGFGWAIKHENETEITWGESGETI